MTDDRRHHARIAFHSPARLALADRHLEVVVLDISLKGALIRLPADTALEAGTLCSLHIQLHEADADNPIVMEARITHGEGQNAGLLCQSIDLDSVTHLRRLVELNLGDPAMLERELSALIAG